MKKLQTLLILLLLTRMLFAQTTILKIEANQNRYGCIEMDYVWLSSDSTGFEENIYWESAAFKGELEGDSDKNVYRPASISPENRTVHMAEDSDASISFTIPVACSDLKFVRIRYSNYTPQNHDTVTLLYHNQAIARFLPIETGAWENFTEEIFRISIAVPAGVKSSPDTVGFGEVELNSIQTKQVLLSNPGEEQLLITDMDIPDENFLFNTTKTFPIILEPCDTLPVDITFQPFFAAQIKTFLNVTTNTENTLNVPLSGTGTAATVPDSNLVVFEDWTDVVTQNDFGFNDFNGNCGDLGEYGKSSLGDNQLVFKWDFEEQNEVYAGRFFSLFGLTDSKVTTDGTNIETIKWDDYFLNLNNIEGNEINSPFGEKRVTSILSKIYNPGSEKITVKFEIRDINDNKIFRYFIVYPGENYLNWDFRNDKIGNADLTQSKLLSLIVEERHNFYNILNPNAGEINIDYIKFKTLQNYLSPITNDELLTMTQFRAFQYFVDYVGKRPENLGLVQDRSTFPDLFTVGGQGFAFAAWLVGLHNNWITEEWVKARIINVLQLLADEKNFGLDETGKIGYKGFFYHFLGPDGKRKINFDWPETQVDESKNTVELSLIDTGLLLWGLYAVQSYFSDEAEINNLCQQVIENVDWHFVLDEASNQFYVSWKPEIDNLYSIAAPGGGFYSTKNNGEKLLADYYSDEYLMCILAGMDTLLQDPIDTTVWNSLIKDQNANGTIISFPGALFTYQFLQLFYPAHNSWYKSIVDLYYNTTKAILETSAYCESKKQEHKAYNEGLWGLSACEGPSDNYFAFGAAPVAKGGGEDEGTIAIYPIVSSLTYPEAENAAKQQLWNLYNKDGVFHKRMGFADAVHYDIAELAFSDAVLRNSGQWQNRPNFAIDAGPMVMAIQNYKDGFIWNLIENNKNVQAAINTITTGTNSIQSAGLFKLFPNPAKDCINIQFYFVPNNPKTRIQVFNETGQTVYTIETIVLNNNFLKINTRAWVKGMYHVVIQNSDNSWHKKVIVN